MPKAGANRRKGSEGDDEERAKDMCGACYLVTNQFT